MALGGFGRHLHRMHDAAKADVRPDDARARVALEQRLHLRQIRRFGVGLRERHVDVVVKDDDQPALGGELENPIERRIGQARGLAGDLRGHEFLVDAELADAGEDAGERLAARGGCDRRAYMSAGLNPVIIGSKRACSSFGSDAIRAGDERIGERVVVERRVALQVVGRRELAGVAVRPLLLQRDAEQGRTADAAAHDLQELPDVDALLDVVRQVKVRIVECVGRLRLELPAEHAARQEQQRDGERRA